MPGSLPHLGVTDENDPDVEMPNRQTHDNKVNN